MASRVKRSTSRAAEPSRAEKRAATSEAEHVGELYSHIYDVVRCIPRGRVATYGQVAELAGIPGGARVVGAAMRASLPAQALPWQRVVGKRSPTSAQVSIHDPVGAGIQRGLLEREGVAFSPAGAIALARFGWVPAPRRAGLSRAAAGARARPGRRKRGTGRRR